MSSGNSEGRDGAGEQVALQIFRKYKYENGGIGVSKNCVEQSKNCGRLRGFSGWGGFSPQTLENKPLKNVGSTHMIIGPLYGDETIGIHESGACDEDAPDPVEAFLSGCQAKQEGQVHQGIF